MTDVSQQRPLRSRTTGWARNLADRLIEAGVAANLVSYCGFGFSALAGGALALSGLTFGFFRGVLLIAAALAIAARLLCDILDAMVAEHPRRASPTGPVFNGLLDRLSDAMILVGAGYGATHPGILFSAALGWLCALMGAILAYERELGRGLGLTPQFCGPMSKPRRAAIIGAAALLSLFEPMWKGHGLTLLWALGLIAALSVITIVRRARQQMLRLRAQARSSAGEAPLPEAPPAAP